MQKTTSPAQTLNEHLVVIDPKKDKVTTTSLVIAEIFGKRHDNVLRDIEDAKSKLSREFNALNFGVVRYKDKKGEYRKAFELTKNGFMIIAMGYNTENAMQFKESLIKRFDQMELQLTKRLYGECVTITELKKKVPSKLVMFGSQSGKVDAIYFHRKMLRVYLGYTPNPSKRHLELYGHLLDIYDGVSWVNVEYVNMLIRNRTALNQRKRTNFENERIGHIRQERYEATLAMNEKYGFIEGDDFYLPQMGKDLRQIPKVVKIRDLKNKLEEVSHD